MKHTLMVATFVATFNIVAYSQCTLTAPTSLTVNPTSCDATLNWSVVTGATSYKIKYKKATDLTYTYLTATAPPYTVSGLNLNTKYIYYVAANCAGDILSPYSSPAIKTTLKCTTPSGFATDSVSPSSAKIHWVNNCGAGSYTIRYRASGVGPWTTISGVTTLNYTFTSLLPSTTYQYRVRSICGANVSPYSPIQSFTTSLQRPNILLIVLDDSRYDTYIPNGAPAWFNTSNINRIAYEGANFPVCVAASPLCAPSRATFYTGLYPHKNGCLANGYMYDFSLPTVQQILTDNGYRTGFVGKYGQSLGLPKGFDWWTTSVTDEYIDVQYKQNGTNLGVIPGNVLQIYPPFALDFLNSVPSDQPFFLAYFDRAPHNPTVPLPQDDTLFEDPSYVLPFPTNFYKYSTDYPSYFYTTDYLWDLDTAGTIYQKREEYQTIVGIDRYVGILLGWLEDNGQLDNTLIIFTSDNGFMEGEHMLGRKGMAQEESSRLPLFVRYPPWFADSSVYSDIIASNLDIAPTILDAAGIPDTFGMDGISLKLLANHTVERPAFFEEQQGPPSLPSSRSVRTTSYKYILTLCDEQTEEFYDLVNDPRENTNLIHDPAYSSLIADYRNKLDSLRTVFDDISPALEDCYMVVSPGDERLANADDDELYDNGLISVNPNPATNQINVLINDPQNTEKHIYVYNSAGNMIDDEIILNSQNTFTINSSAWPAGIYYIFAQFGTQLSSKQVTVVKN